jgi:hypothetical protein
MPQTFYTTQDEEILSIVGRLRSSELLENIFVIPKRALVLQSIVNLRMLAREAEKAGKQVVIVTQDENGRRLAEKAGIETRPYSEEASRETEPVIREVPADEPVLHHPGISADSIGSSGFFSTPSDNGVSASGIDRNVTSPAGNGMRLRIRNASPVRQPSLNSMRQTEPEVSSVRPRSSMPVQAPQETTRVAAPLRNEIPDSSGRLSRVFAPPKPVERRQPEPVRAKRESHTLVGGKGKSWFAGFVVISVLFLVGTGAFIFLPKAEISVVPMSVSQDIGMEFDGRTDATAEGERVVPVRIVEKEETVTVTGETSGSSSGNGSKASGKILIYNEYGSDSQQLVATTRFQSADGKIFRLSKGVTVPGVTERNGQREPGVVEADVVADGSGSEYNIGTTNFSIPGFSGSAKAGKIYAKSKSSMSGGSSVGQSGATSVSAADLEKAKGDATETFRRSFSDSLSRDLAQNERFIPETFDIAVVGSPSAPGAGSVASSFEYKATFHAKAFVFSEDELKDRAVALLRKKSSIDDGFEARDVTFRYEGGTADYQAGTFRFKANVNALFVASIDIGALREDFLGKKADEIKPILEKHPEVKNIEIELKPKGFSFAVPKDRKRVTVTVMQP